MRLTLFALMAASLLSFGRAPAVASPQPEWSLQRFRPAVHSLGGFTVEGARVSKGLTANAFIMANVASDILRDRNGRPIVDYFGTTDLVASFSLFGHLSLGLDLPFHYADGLYLDGGPLPNLALGDLRLSVKATFFKPRRVGFGLGLSLDVVAPTGTEGRYAREAGVVVAPKIVADYMMEELHLMLNLWLYGRSYSFDPIRSGASIPLPEDLSIDSEIGLSAALAVFLGSRDLRFIAESRFETRISDLFGNHNSALEFTGGFHWNILGAIGVGVGASVGALPGDGDPGWRTFVVAGYQPNDLFPAEPSPSPPQTAVTPYASELPPTSEHSARAPTPDTEPEPSAADTLSPEHGDATPAEAL